MRRVWDQLDPAHGWSSVAVRPRCAFGILSTESDLLTCPDRLALEWGSRRGERVATSLRARIGATDDDAVRDAECVSLLVVSMAGSG